MLAFKKVIAILMLFCTVLSGCAENTVEKQSISETTEAMTNSPQESPEIQENPVTDTYEFNVTVSENRELTISLELIQSDDLYTAEITEVQIYDADVLLQTITKDDIPEVTDYAWDGLFLCLSDDTIGPPDVRDLNFDGSEDFGLLAVESYPNNVPYSYFFWNAEKECFEYQFTAFGPGWLQIDEAQNRLVETSSTGTETHIKYFTFGPDGSVESPLDDAAWQDSIVFGSDTLDEFYASIDNVQYVGGYTGTFSDTEGYAVLTAGVALGTQPIRIYLTSDSGETWEEIGNPFDQHAFVLTGAAFSSSTTGFLSYRYTVDAGPDIWWTSNGGSTWAQLPVDLPDEYRNADGSTKQEYRFTPNTPTFEDGNGIYPITVLNVETEEETTIHMYSSDNGMTWNFG